MSTVKGHLVRLVLSVPHIKYSPKVASKTGASLLVRVGGLGLGACRERLRART